MAQGQANLTNADNSLKEDYAPKIESAIRTSNPLMERIRTKIAKSSPFGGKSFRQNIPLEIGRNWSVQHYSEDGGLPTPDHIEYDVSTPTLASLDGAIKLSGHILDATESNPAAFVSAMTAEVRQMVQTMSLRIGIAYHGNGSGILALANGAGVAATALVVDGPDNRWMDRNMYVDIYNGTTLEVDGIKLSDVGTNGTTATLASAQTWSTNSQIYLKGEYGQTIIQGLLGIVDDGAGTPELQGISSRSTKSYWQGQLVDGGGASMSEDLVQSAIDQVEKFGVDSQIDMLLCDHLTRRYFFEAVLTNKQRIVDSSRGEGGFTGLVYQTGTRAVPLFVDRLAYPGYLYGLDTSKFIAGWAPKVGGRWMDRGHGILKQEVASGVYKDNWRADYYCRHGLFVKNTVNHFRLYNFIAPA